MKALSWMNTGHPVRAAQIARDPEPRPFMCGGCGAQFASKGAKRRHKAECDEALPDVVPVTDDERCDDADLYSRERHITPEVKARADAEWRAMDWRGRLPEGWTYEPGEGRT